MISNVAVLALLSVPLFPAQDAAPPAEAEKKLDAVLVPAEHVELSLRPEEFRGEWRLLEVAPHGAYVNEGDVIARFDPEPIQRALDDLAFEVEGLALAESNAREQAELAQEAAADQLAESRSALERSRRALDGYLKFELEFQREAQALSAMYTEHNIEDQVDELTQLEAMYGDDELVDATEEIVLKRSRRNLARTQRSKRLAERRLEYTETYETAPEVERRQEALERQNRAFERLVRSQRIEARSRERGLSQAERALAQGNAKLGRMEADVELLVLRAPRTGVVLHGGREDYGAGRVRPDYKTGDRAPAEKALFLLTQPDRLDAHLSLPESALADLHQGMGVRLELPGDREGRGTLHWERYPTPKSAAAPENLYDARVRVEGALQGLVPGMRVQVRPGGSVPVGDPESREVR